MDRFYREIFQFVQTYIKIKIGWHCGHLRRNSIYIYIPHLCRVHRVYLMVRQKCAPEIWHFFYCTTSQRVTLNSPITRKGIYGQFFKIFRRKTNSANAFVAWTARTIRRLIILRYFTRINRCVVALNVRDAAVNCARFFFVRTISNAVWCHKTYVERFTAHVGSRFDVRMGEQKDDKKGKWIAYQLRVRRN